MVAPTTISPQGVPVDALAVRLGVVGVGGDEGQGARLADRAAGAGRVAVQPAQQLVEAAGAPGRHLGVGVVANTT
jgi:hypothetical protein